MTRPDLPPQMHVFVRDWLSANHVVLRSDAGSIVIDSGYATHVPLMLALIASRTGLDGRPLAKVVNTHCHSDHIGGNAALRRAYGCPIAVPVGSAADRRGTSERCCTTTRTSAPSGCRRRSRCRAGHTSGAISSGVRCRTGHAMGALVFFNDAHRS
jgi:glyoxylase-like metal-dependent hydrolase (beta-lactamase superfamily II)